MGYSLTNQFEEFRDTVLVPSLLDQLGSLILEGKRIAIAASFRRPFNDGEELFTYMIDDDLIYEYGCDNYTSVLVIPTLQREFKKYLVVNGQDAEDVDVADIMDDLYDGHRKKEIVKKFITFVETQVEILTYKELAEIGDLLDHNWVATIVKNSNGDFIEQKFETYKPGY